MSCRANVGSRKWEVGSEDAPPRVLLGPGGEYVRAVGPGETFMPAAWRHKRMVLGGTVARMEIPANGGVVIRNAEPGTEVEWMEITAAIGQVAEKVKWGVGVVEAFCAGVALGLVGLTVALWLVMR